MLLNDGVNLMMILIRLPVATEPGPPASAVAAQVAQVTVSVDRFLDLSNERQPSELPPRPAD